MSALIFPTLSGLDIDIQRTPIYSTEVQQSSNGLELRAAFWSYPRYKISLSFNFLRSATYTKSTQNEWETLVGFFARMAANYDTFYFEMPDDYFVGVLASPASATSMPIGVGNGSTTAFQLQRTLVPSASLAAAASRSYYPTIGDGYEPIFVVNNTTPPSIFVNSTLKTVTTDYTINNTTGILTFTSAPASAAIISFTGSYYWNCRLEKEQYDFSRMLNGVWEAKTINLITVKS